MSSNEVFVRDEYITEENVDNASGLSKKTIDDNLKDYLKKLDYFIGMDKLEYVEDVKSLLKEVEAFFTDIFYFETIYGEEFIPKFREFNFKYHKLSLECQSIEISNSLDAAKKEVNNLNREINDLRNSNKSLLSSIISIVLSITIIPTAISVLNDVETIYILPIVATIVMFGIVMITFIYLINNVQIGGPARACIGFVVALTIFLWVLSYISLNREYGTSKTVSVNCNSSGDFAYNSRSVSGE